MKTHKTLFVRQAGNGDWMLYADSQPLVSYACKESAIGRALAMEREYPGKYAVCVEDEPQRHDYYGHRRDQVVFSAAVVLGSLILGFVLGCIAAGMKAGVFKW